MKKQIAAAMAAMALLAGCDDDKESVYSYSMPVSVTMDKMTGKTILLADADFYLEPQNLSDFKGIESVVRLYVSFNVSEPINFEAGKTYKVTLLTSSGSYSLIPTFGEAIDIASEEYKTGGNDSLTVNAREVISMTANGDPYFANGYLNIKPTFVYLNTVPVYFGAYYDSESDVVVEGGKAKVTLTLYYSTPTQSPLYTTSSHISIPTPSAIYDQLREAGLTDKDEVTVVVKGKVGMGEPSKSEVLTTVEDFLR